MARRIVSLWLVYARMDLLWLLKDFRNFFINTATNLIINIASITGIWLLAVRFNGIGGLGIYQVLFMLGYSLTVSGLIDTFFSFNIYFISRIIGRGQMDHILIMPQPVWVTLLTQGFIPVSGSGALIAGLGVMIFALAKIGSLTGVVFIAALIMCIGLSVVISLSFTFLVGCLAFYSPVATEEVCTSVGDAFSALRNFPLSGTGISVRIVMLSVLPVGLFAWFPATALIGASSTLNIGLFAAISAAYLGLALIVFGKGLQHYVKNGSYRYSDRGHRR